MMSIKNRIFVPLMLLLIACNGSNKPTGKAELKPASGGEQVAVFAGGCFWGIQEAFSQLKGVKSATSGYAGGTTKDPTYEEVNTETTGHAEAVRIVYDPNLISFSKLLEVFFVIHDGTQLNRQGPDVGTSYRSIAFYSNEAEKAEIEKAIATQNRSQLHPGTIVTEILPMPTFYPAEQYHQEYVKLHPDEPYVAMVCAPKVEKMRKAFPQLLKDELK